jgi:hypothetical protein
VGCGVSDPQHKTHAIMARGIVNMHRLHPGKYDLEAQIVSLLEYAQESERRFWQEIIQGAIAVCEAQGKAEGAEVLRAILESEAA